MADLLRHLLQVVGNLQISLVLFSRLPSPQDQGVWKVAQESNFKIWEVAQMKECERNLEDTEVCRSRIHKKKKKNKNKIQKIVSEDVPKYSPSLRVASGAVHHNES